MLLHWTVIQSILGEVYHDGAVGIQDYAQRAVCYFVYQYPLWPLTPSFSQVCLGLERERHIQSETRTHNILVSHMILIEIEATHYSVHRIRNCTHSRGDLSCIFYQKEKNWEGNCGLTNPSEASFKGKDGPAFAGSRELTALMLVLIGPKHPKQFSKRRSWASSFGLWGSCFAGL